MEFNEFCYRLGRQLELMNAGTEICQRKVLKNNGVEKTAVIILPEGAECAPNIYLEPVYSLYNNMKLSIEEAGEYVMHLHGRILGQTRAGCMLRKDAEDYEKIREKLILRMVNREQNEKMLDDAVSIPFLDLAGVFYVAEDMEKMDVVMRVSRELMKCWGVDREEMKKTALENLRRKGKFQLRDIREVISLGGREPIREAERGESGMYVLTDASMKNGPAALLLPEILEKTADELGSDILLLPSSVYELIVLRDRKSEFWRREYWELKKIVGEINKSIVDPEDVLGNSVYKYSREQSELTAAV